MKDKKGLSAQLGVWKLKSVLCFDLNHGVNELWYEVGYIRNTQYNFYYFNQIKNR